MLGWWLLYVHIRLIRYVDIKACGRIMCYVHMEACSHVHKVTPVENEPFHATCTHAQRCCSRRVRGVVVTLEWVSEGIGIRIAAENRNGCNRFRRNVIAITA
jgi:hypothetical protein